MQQKIQNDRITENLQIITVNRLVTTMIIRRITTANGTLRQQILKLNKRKLDIRQSHLIITHQLVEIENFTPHFSHCEISQEVTFNWAFYLLEKSQFNVRTFSFHLLNKVRQFSCFQQTVENHNFQKYQRFTSNKPECSN